MALSAKDWKTFLDRVGIPEPASNNYATMFADNRIQKYTDLTKDTLKELGVTVLGDIIAISRAAKELGPQAPIQEEKAQKSHFKPKVELPRLKGLMTAAEFRKFKLDWEVYKTITQLSKSQIAPQLYTACDTEVQNSIINTAPGFLTDDENDNMKTIETIVTRQSNPAVHRLTFSNITQTESETITAFLVRLKSAAKDCEYECHNCQHDLSNNHIKDQLIRGLHNSILQTDILAKWSSLRSLEEIVKHAQAFESAIRDQSNLTGQAEAMRISDYQMKKRELTTPSGYKSHSNASTKTPQGYNSRRCTGCGSTRHVNKNRSTSCPAWGQTCHNCGVKNHFASQCRKSRANEARTESDEDEVLAHVTLSGDVYTTVSSVCTQEIPANITPLVKGKEQTTTCTLVFPDSGAGICLAGSQHIDRLGITSKDLTHCNKRVMAVGGTVLTCKGWIMVNFQVGERRTQQKLFICDNIDRIYFSREACTDVRILPTSFPYPMDQTVKVESISTGGDKSQASLPFPPKEENIGRLKDHLINSFPEVFVRSTPFKSMNCKPVHIHLKDDAIPAAIHVPIPIPLHWKEEIKADLDRDVKNGIIEPVPVGERVTWCSPMVVVPKKDGRPRRTVDLQKLNKQCHRETHHCQSPFKLACQVPSETKKTVLDATDGYHSIPLDEESKHLTTFITEWGRFRYRRLPQGFITAGDAYTRRYDDIIKDVENKVKCVDDTLLWANNIELSYKQVHQYLQICQENGITLNKEKFQFCQDAVTFAGLRITTDGIRPCPKTLQAIRDFPTPSDLTGARSWFGLVNTVAWAYSMTDAMQPFRDLVKPKAKFYWDDTLNNVFQKSKDVIIEKAIEGIKTYDIGKTTCIQTDWSRDGIGYLLLQKNCQCTQTSNPICCKNGWQLVFAGSRFTKGAETRYSPTEGEALAVAWSLEHARIFVLGCRDLFVSTDHKPLEGILKDRNLSTISNPRLLNLKQRTLQFHFTVKYNPGKWHRGPDALSRHPIQTPLVQAIFSEDDPSPADEIRIEHVEEKIEAILTTTSELNQAATTDKEYRDLFTVVTNGFPSTKDAIEPHLKTYWNVRNRLSLEGPLVMLEGRIVIPGTLKSKVLDNLHSAHQGVSSMIGRAIQSIYWPGMEADIRNKRYSCHKCNERAPSQSREPYCPSPSPTYPFQQICLDFFEVGHHQYLVCVDRFSAWIIIYHFRSQATGRKLVKICRDISSHYGVPEEISSDGGPQFASSDFQTFMKDWGIHHRLSSVNYPQSNGRAELGVKTAKRILLDNANPDGSLDNDRVLRAILQNRNTPIPELGLSPAQILLHKQLRDSIPATVELYKPHKDWIISAEQREKAFAAKYKHLATTYNEHSRKLKPLSVRMTVRVQEKGKWNRSGRIVEVLPNHQYRVKMEGSGRITLRNRRFLKETPSIIPSPFVITQNTPGSEQMMQGDHPDTPPMSPSTFPIDNQPQFDSPPRKKITGPLKRIADYNKRGLQENEGETRSRLRGGKE